MSVGVDVNVDVGVDVGVDVDVEWNSGRAALESSRCSCCKRTEAYVAERLRTGKEKNQVIEP